jgi:hypothetical protein
VKEYFYEHARVATVCRITLQWLLLLSRALALQLRGHAARFNGRRSLEMKPVIQFIKPAVILGGLLLALPMVGLADKGGKPNVKSEAITAACLEDDDTAHVYSCKGLSNVVLWCNGETVKHDDIEGESGEELFDAEFDCVDAEGNPISGPITMIAVKSGSQKNVDSGTPPGSGLFVGEILDCTDSSFVFPLEGECNGGVDPQ